MQQYAEESSLAITAASSLSIVRGLNDGQLHVMKRVRCIPCKTKEEQMALAYAVQEARLLMLVRHPNIVCAKDFFTEGEHHCIVLEYCSAGDLKQQIDAAASARKGLEAKSVLGWIEGIASAAAHFHAQGVLHRDLKPANVFLMALDGRHGDVRVGDFGAARQLHTGQASIRSKLTGTQHYMVRLMRGFCSYHRASPFTSQGAPFCRPTCVMC